MIAQRLLGENTKTKGFTLILVDVLDDYSFGYDHTCSGRCLFVSLFMLCCFLLNNINYVDLQCT